jgi:hypothetical protein
MDNVEWRLTNVFSLNVEPVDFAASSRATRAAADDAHNRLPTRAAFWRLCHVFLYAVGSVCCIQAGASETSSMCLTLSFYLKAHA